MKAMNSTSDRGRANTASGAVFAMESAVIFVKRRSSVMPRGDKGAYTDNRSDKPSISKKAMKSVALQRTKLKLAPGPP